MLEGGGLYALQLPNPPLSQYQWLFNAKRLNPPQAAPNQKGLTSVVDLKFLLGRGARLALYF